MLFKNREFLGVLILNVLCFSTITMAEPLAPLLIADMGYTEDILGLILSLGAIGALLSTLPAGFIIGRYGPLRPLLLSLLLMTLSTVIIYTFHAIEAMTLGLVLLEAGKVLFVIASQASVGVLSNTENSSGLFGWLTGAASLGQIVGPVAAGLLIDQTNSYFPWLVMSIGTICAILVWIAFLNSRITSHSTHRVESLISLKSKVRLFFRVPIIIPVLAGFFILLSLSSRRAFFPLHVRNAGFSAAITGALLSTRAFISLLVRIFINPIVRKLKRRTAIVVVCLFFAGIGLLILPVATNIGLLLVNAIFIGVAIGLGMPLGIAIISDNSKPEHLGIAFSTRQLFNRGANLLGPVLFGLIAVSAGLNSTFLVAGLIAVLAAVLPMGIPKFRRHLR